MSRKAKIRGILGKKGIHNYDIVIFLLFMALLFLLKGNVPYLQDLVSFRSEISLGYIAKQQGDRIYEPAMKYLRSPIPRMTGRVFCI